MNQTTPSSLDATVTNFCRSELGGEPRYVSLQILPYCQHGMCFLNVWDAVKQYGGKAVYGWIVWYDPGVLIEGEYHAVWERPDGLLVDVTPKPDGEEQIAFVSTGYEPNEITGKLQQAIERKLSNPDSPPVYGPLYLTTNKRKYLKGGS